MLDGISPMRLAGSLGSRAITNARPASIGPKLDLVSLTHLGRGTFEFERAWTRGAWEDLSFPDMWPHLGGEGLAARDLWLVRSGLPRLEEELLDSSATWALFGDSLLPGIYVLEGPQLSCMPLVANNRAHLVRPDYVLQMLRQAADDGRYVAMPTWYAHYADMTPPNLYAQQRMQYERLFAPRSWHPREDSRTEASGGNRLAEDAFREHSEV